MFRVRVIVSFMHISNSMQTVNLGSFNTVTKLFRISMNILHVFLGIFCVQLEAVLVHFTHTIVIQ